MYMRLRLGMPRNVLSSGGDASEIRSRPRFLQQGVHRATPQRKCLCYRQFLKTCHATPSVDEGNVDWQEEYFLQPGMQRRLPHRVDRMRRLDKQIDVTSTTVVLRAGAVQEDGGILAGVVAHGPHDRFVLIGRQPHRWRAFALGGDPQPVGFSGATPTN